MNKKAIWVLGSEHHNAHKSIPWNPPFPNFSNCDVLIINLQSLNDSRFQKIKNALFNEARRYIFDMLMTQEKEIIIILTTNQEMLKWLPLYPIVKTIAPVKIGKCSIDTSIDDYIKTVEECSYYIRDFEAGYVYALTNPESKMSEKYHFTSEARRGYSLDVLDEKVMKNKARQLVGGFFRFRIIYGLLFREGAFTSGRIVFLPPPTKVNAEQAIDLIVNKLTGAELIESPPRWENVVDLPGLKDINEEIQGKEKEKEQIIEQIEELSRKRDYLIRFRRLLWTKGTPLENIVRDAFIFLGFPEICKLREENLEDWVIEFKYTKRYQYGVFEIKGANERTSLADLTQCNKWVEDYLLENKKAKGIFIPNQYRLEDINKSLEKREHFEPNEKDYAETRDICILPAHEIFFAVVEKLKGNSNITRQYIEERIANTKGICKLI